MPFRQHTTTFFCCSLAYKIVVLCSFVSHTLSLIIWPNTVAEDCAMEGSLKSYLGSGYDACGRYADGVSIKRKIFDLDRVPKKYIRQLSNRSADFFSVVGETVEEYQHSLGVKAGISGSYKLFSGSVEASFNSMDLAIEESSFVSIELCMRYETWKLQTTDTQYMYHEVLEDFKTKDGKWLIENYGGCVVMGMDTGGRWNDNLVVSKLFEHSTNDVSVAMEAAYGSLVEGHGSTEISETLKREKSIASRQVTVIGGNPAYAPGDLEKWQASVEEYPALMDFTKDGFIEIWNLFPQYEEKLKKGFDAYVKEHALTIKKKRIIEARYIEGQKYASDAGSGARRDLHLYKPQSVDNWRYLGVGGNSNKILVVKELSDRYGALRDASESDDWLPVWNDRGSGNSRDYNCWLPVGPPGFVALGVYCRFGVHGQGPPSKEEAKGLAMVHSSLVTPCELIEGDVWSDAGSGADYDLRLGRLPHMALWPGYTSDPNAGILPTKYTLKPEYMN